VSTLHGRDIDRERDLDYRQSRDLDRDQDHEISLGTGTILGIFFALALLCAVFFGFGYSMGRKSAQPTVSTADATPPSTTLFGGTKPSPGSPIASASKSADFAPNPAPNTASDSDTDSPSPQTAANAEDSASTPKQASGAPRTTSSAVVEDTSAPVAVKAVAKNSTPAMPPARASVADSAMPQINPNGTVMVQVAAVSHQEDADLLVSALKNRGYAVFIRQETQDHLLHVQVGPFATRKDADAMRQHLLADGYNAIVK